MMGYWMGSHFNDWIVSNGVTFFERGARIRFYTFLGF